MNTLLVLCNGVLKVLVLLSQSCDLGFLTPERVFILRLQVLGLQVQHSLLALSIRLILLQPGFKLLGLLALSVKLSISILLLGLESLGLLTNLSLKLFTIHLDPVFVPLHSPFKLRI